VRREDKTKQEHRIRCSSQRVTRTQFLGRVLGTVQDKPKICWVTGMVTGEFTPALTNHEPSDVPRRI
jgi:hypothetical protein